MTRGERSVAIGALLPLAIMFGGLFDISHELYQQTAALDRATAELHQFSVNMTPPGETHDKKAEETLAQIEQQMQEALLPPPPRGKK